MWLLFLSVLGGNVSGEGEEEDTPNTVPTFKDAFEDSLSAALKNATAASNGQLSVQL